MLRQILSALGLELPRCMPKPAKKLTPADLQRLQAAEAKRQRKRQRLKNVQAN